MPVPGIIDDISGKPHMWKSKVWQFLLQQDKDRIYENVSFGTILPLPKTPYLIDKPEPPCQKVLSNSDQMNISGTTLQLELL